MQPKFEKRALRVIADFSDNNLVPKALKAVALSPETSYIAWFTGHRELLITKWNPSKYPAHQTQNKTLLLAANDTIWTMVFGKLGTGRGLIDQSTNNQLKRRSGGFVRFQDRNELFLIAGTKAGRINIWSVDSGKLYLELTDHRDKISELCLNPNNSKSLLSSSYDGTLKLWDLADDGNMFKTLKVGDAQLSCDWSNCGRLIASGGRDRTVTIWNTCDWKGVYELQGHIHSVSKVKFFPDSSLLVSASRDSSVILWNPWNGTRIRTLWHMLPKPSPIVAFGENEHEVCDLTVSPDGIHIATACQDGVLRVWDKDMMQPVDTCTIDQLSHCQYSDNGNYLVIGSRTGLRQVLCTPMKVDSLLHMCIVSIRQNVKREHVSKLNLPLNIIDGLQNPHIPYMDTTHNYQFV